MESPHDTNESIRQQAAAVESSFEALLRNLGDLEQTYLADCFEFGVKRLPQIESVVQSALCDFRSVEPTRQRDGLSTDSECISHARRTAEQCKTLGDSQERLFSAASHHHVATESLVRDAVRLASDALEKQIDKDGDDQREFAEARRAEIEPILLSIDRHRRCYLIYREAMPSALEGCAASDAEMDNLTRRARNIRRWCETLAQGFEGADHG